jgi:hypothetical protein
VDRLSIRLPLADDRDFLADDVVGRHRGGRHQQDEDVAGAKLRLDFRVPVGAARHLAIDPDVEDAAFDGWPKKSHHKAEPLHIAVSGLFRLVGVRVADEDDRPGRCVGHADPTTLLGKCQRTDASQADCWAVGRVGGRRNRPLTTCRAPLCEGRWADRETRAIREII